MRRYFRILLGILLVAGAIFVWCKHHSENQNVDAQPDVQAGIERLPDYDYVYYGDTKNLPYGEKNSEQVLAYTIDAIKFLIKQKMNF